MRTSRWQVVGSRWLVQWQRMLFSVRVTCQVNGSDEQYVADEVGHLLPWLRSSCGDMVWNALMLVTLLLPLASLTIDVPRYFVLRARLQLAADAAAEATAQCVDLPLFQRSGETRLSFWCRIGEPVALFSDITRPLGDKGYQPTLANISVDEQQRVVRVQAFGTTRLFFGLTPAVRVRVQAQSRYRMQVQ